METDIPDKPKILEPKEGPASIIVVFFVVSLAIFPFVSAFNDLLTNWVISLKAYKVITEFIVPQQIKWVVVILRFLGVEAQATSEYILIPTTDKKYLFELIWNCIGWQSFIMFVLTSGVLLSKKFRLFSRIKAVLLGICGTILVNILRIVAVIWLFRFMGGGFAIIFHDYGALVTNTLWLIGFWSFAYSYILEESV